MKETIKNTIQPLYPVEKCWWCGGFGRKPCFVTEQHPDGYEKCMACNGTGYAPPPEIPESVKAEIDQRVPELMRKIYEQQ